jgi:hypothetical protein
MPMPQGTRIDVAQFGGNNFPQVSASVHFNLHGQYKITDWHDNSTVEFYQQGFEGPALIKNVQLANGDTVATGQVTVVF